MGKKKKKMRKGKMTENKMEPRAKQICKLHVLKI